jgi:hypothetical protein
MTHKYDPRFLKSLQADQAPEDKPVKLPTLKSSPKQTEKKKPIIPPLNLVEALKIQNKQ